MIEASHFDAAEAYAAVDRHRLDDRAPYLYRTKDYGKTWQPIVGGIGANAFLNAIREDTKQRGLLFAGTELGVYVSFDDGDHWQPLQANLPVTSVRDLVIHGDDAVIATHGRAFWMLDNITPLRQIAAGVNTEKARLFTPAAAARVDNDSFLGSPFPPEEPLAKNPPNGAVIDYYLPATANKVTLEIFDAKGALVRRYVSGEKKPERTRPLPIAERWLPRPVSLETAAGMHRFVWDLRWDASGDGEELEEDEYSAPRGPRVAPGTYQVKLAVDRATMIQSLEIQMDPRSKATAEVLKEQERFGLEIYGKALRSAKALAEAKSALTSLQRLTAQLNNQPKLQAQAENLLAAVRLIIQGKGADSLGLEVANGGVQSILRVVESGDRTTPQQALEVYRLAEPAARIQIAEWEKVKTGTLAEFNRAVTTVR